MDQASQRQEDGHTKQASIFHSRLWGAITSLPLWLVVPAGPGPYPEPPSGLKPEEQVTRGLGQADRLQHPTTHIQSAPPLTSASPMCA